MKAEKRKLAECARNARARGRTSGGGGVDDSRHKQRDSRHNSATGESKRHSRREKTTRRVKENGLLFNENALLFARNRPLFSTPLLLPHHFCEKVPSFSPHHFPYSTGGVLKARAEGWRILKNEYIRTINSTKLERLTSALCPKPPNAPNFKPPFGASPTMCAALSTAGTSNSLCSAPSSTAISAKILLPTWKAATPISTTLNMPTAK